MNWKTTLVALAAVLSAPALARADAIPTTRDITSVRAAGMGGAAIGFASSNEALLINPAGIAAVTRFNAAGSAAFDPPNHFRVLAIDSVDSKLNADEGFPLAGGVGYYNYFSGKDEARRSGSLLAAGLALPLYPEAFFIGATAKYLKLTGAVDTSAVTLDAAAMLKFGQLGLAAVGYNLIDVQSQEARRSWGFGAAVGTDLSFHVDFDVRLDPNAEDDLVPTYRVGAEYLFGGFVMPRAGYIEDKLRGLHEVTAGVSVFFSGLAVEGFYQHSLNGVGRAFGFALRLLDSPFSAGH